MKNKITKVRRIHARFISAFVQVFLFDCLTPDVAC